jgi:hypothetical protein
MAAKGCGMPGLGLMGIVTSGGLRALRLTLLDAPSWRFASGTVHLLGGLPWG